MDHEGFLYIRDRAKDIIIRGGENISATGVENAIFKNPKVQDCAVVGVTDKRLGELPAAVQLNILFTRPKPSGGRRIVGNLASFYRNYTRARLDYVRQWDGGRRIA